ncbi:MAG TPA: hypothetical protein VMX74_05030 [Pirellulales bacterium]|nr:hypothetical protein [Pirellulales bacterium]
MSDLIRITGLWEKRSKKPGGSAFLSGEAQEDVPKGARLLAFFNGQKRNDADPDYTLYVAPDDPNYQRQGQGQQASSATAGAGEDDF